MLLRMSLLGMVAAMVLSLAPVVGSDDKDKPPQTAAADRSAAKPPHAPRAVPEAGALPVSPRLPVDADIHRSDKALLGRVILRGDAKKARAPAASTTAKAAPPAPVQPTAVEASIEKILDETADLKFSKETPLADVMASLSQQYGIPIQLDRRALDEVGIATDTPIVREIYGTTLRTSLRLLLRDLNLTWLVQDGVLLVTTPEEAAAMRVTRVYDVSDLVVYRDSQGELFDDYEPLVSAIEDHVRSDTWDSMGGVGTVSGASMGGAKMLLVTQSYEVHAEVRKLLEEIRALGAKATDKKPPLRNVRPEPPVSPGKSSSGS